MHDCDIFHIPPIDRLVERFARLVQPPGYVLSLGEQAEIVWPVYLRAGVTVTGKALLDEIVARLDVHLERHPDCAWARYYRGQALFRRGRLDEADSLYRRAIALLEQTASSNDPTLPSTGNASGGTGYRVRASSARPGSGVKVATSVPW